MAEWDIVYPLTATIQTWRLLLYSTFSFIKWLKQQHGCVAVFFCVIPISIFKIGQLGLTCSCELRSTTLGVSSSGRQSVELIFLGCWSACLMWHSCVGNFGIESSTIKSFPVTVMSACICSASGERVVSRGKSNVGSSPLNINGIYIHFLSHITIPTACGNISSS